MLMIKQRERDLDYNTLDTLDKFSSRIHGRGVAHAKEDGEKGVERVLGECFGERETRTN